MSYYILRRGREYKCDFIVENWRQHALQFFGRTRKATHHIVAHWTAAENPPERVFHNMRNHTDDDGKPEPLSVHFCVDAAGLVYQFADAEMRCSHVGTSANDIAVGIEFVCPGDNEKIKRGPAYRETHVASVHGRLVRYRSLTASQVAVGVQLMRTLSEIYDLPFTVPLDEQGHILSTVLDEVAMRRFRGCTEHMNYKPTKRDCAGTMLRAIRAAGSEPLVG